MARMNALKSSESLSAQDLNGGCYFGTDILEAMQAAIKYNRSLSDFVLKYFPRGSYLIDYGAGIGTISEQVRSDGYKVGCAEIDPSMQRILNGLGFETHAALSAFNSKKVDGIFSFNVLEHIRDDKASLEEMSTFLQSGAAILIYVPAFETLYSSMDRKVGHYRRYTRRELERKVTAAGFIVEDSGYSDSLGYPASLIYKWFGAKDGSISIKALKFYDQSVYPISLFFDRALKSMFGKNAFVFARKV